MNERKREWDRRNPDKRRAEKQLENALLRASVAEHSCEACEADQAYGYHLNGDSPHAVTWLCSACFGDHRRCAA